MNTLSTFLLLLTACLLVVLFFTQRERDKWHTLYVHCETALRKECQRSDQMYEDVTEVRALNEKLQADGKWLLERNAELANHLSPAPTEN